VPNSTNPQTNAEMEIDLVEVFKAIVRGRLPIAIALALSVALAAIYCFQFLPDVYSATTSLYVLNQIDQTVISSSDLSSSALLVNDYREIITSRRVTGAVAEELNLENLQDFTIEVEAPTDTRIIEVTVTGEDPELVMEVANGLAQEFSRYVVSIMRIDNVSIIDEALLPGAPSGPPRERYIIMAAMLAVIGTMGVLAAIEIFSTSLKSADDVEKQIGIPVLAQVVWVDLESKEKKKKKRRRAE